MKPIIGIILIVVGLFLGYKGIQNLSNSETSVEIGELELKASDNSQKETAYVYIGGGVLLLAGGVFLTSKK